jgi:hypothetical protein
VIDFLSVKRRQMSRAGRIYRELLARIKLQPGGKADFYITPISQKYGLRTTYVSECLRELAIAGLIYEKSGRFYPVETPPDHEEIILKWLEDLTPIPA